MKRPDINKYPISVDGKHQYYNDDIKKYIDYLEAENKQLLLHDVSQQRELLETYQHFIDWNEEHDRKASTSERIEAFIVNNCG